MKTNILLLILDSVRAQNTGLHGHYHQTTPNIKIFAERSTVYTQARAPGIWSLPSHASIFTGLEVPEHRIVSPSDKLKPGVSIWETLQNKYEYDTGLFTRNGYVSDDRHGLNRGFEYIGEKPKSFTYPFEGNSPEDLRRELGVAPSFVDYVRYAFETSNTFGSLANGIAGKYPNLLERISSDLHPSYPNQAQRLTDQFINWLKGREDNWAVCINYGDAHHPYQPVESHNKWGDEFLSELMKSISDVEWDFWTGKRPWWQLEALEYLYDGGIHQIDKQVGKIINILDEMGELDETFIVITSDHGEGFGEQDPTRDFRCAEHKYGSHEVHYHVPLLVHHPGQHKKEYIRRVATLSRFPEVIRSLVDGEKSTKQFAPNGPVVAYATGGNVQNSSNSTIKSLRDEQFAGETKIVYRNKDDRIRKSVVWGDDQSTVEVIDAQNRMKTQSSVGDGVSIFNTFTPKDVRMDASNETYEESTKKALRDLGYI